MTGPERPKPLKELDQRLRAARKGQTGKGQTERRGKPAGSGLGLGLRIATEIVAAIAVGVVIGILLDRWLGTQPLFLIVFFVLGSAAALRNVMRLAKEAEQHASRTGENGES